MIKTLHGDLSLPTFFPDGTVGVVRGVDSRDLEKAGVEGMVTSTFHLLAHNVEQDLHQLMDWDRPILTDSGGFQVFSLLRDHPKMGRLTDDGFIFEWNGQKVELTPEKSIELQYNLGADILICLDQCTDPEMDLDFQEEAVEKTVKWAKRCKEEFEKITKKQDTRYKPLLFAVVQGGNDPELRRECAKELTKIGFDGYCYGGVPIDRNKQLLEGILSLTAAQMPPDKPKYALGVGKPEDIVKCFQMGYGIFDCVIPTREARHKRLYIFNPAVEHPTGVQRDFYYTETVNLKFANDQRPIANDCDCYTCQNFSRAYLFHLFKVGDTLALRLATIHNLRFYTMLMEKLKI